jgi:hypothetical protein
VSRLLSESFGDVEGWWMVVDSDDVWRDTLRLHQGIVCFRCNASEHGTEELFGLANTDFPRWCAVVAERARSLGWEVAPGELFYCPDCAKHKLAVPALRPGVLSEVRWRLGRPPIADPAAFSEQVRQYQIENTGEDIWWRPAACVIPRPKVQVIYSVPERGAPVERSVTLEADNGAWFTAGELLFKLHNATAEGLRGADHCFFEGLGLLERTEGWEVLVYILYQGS